MAAAVERGPSMLIRVRTPDRLLHHSHVPTIRGDSFRLRAKCKSVLIKPPAGDGAAVGSASLRSAIGHHQPTS